MFYNYHGEDNDKNAADSANANGSTPPENKNDINFAGTGSNDRISRDSASNDSANERYSDPWREPLYTSPKKDLDSFYSPSFQSNSKAAYAAVETKTKKEKPGALRFFALLMVCLVLCAAGSALTTALVIDYKMDSNSSVTSNQVTLGSPTANSDNSNSPASGVTGNALSSSEIYDLACQQVVGVNTSISTTNIFGQESKSAVSGSGFVISEDGYILTNYHVVEYAAVYGYELTVVMFDGSTYPATIVGYEADNDTAVIKIDASGLNAVTLGNSDSISVGDTIYAVGNPLGELTYTMTSGMISALDRFIATTETTTINMFQIDAAVNSGNSGGPVYNTYGQVIGIVTAKYSEAGVEGLGFVIPINDALDIATQLIENGYVSGKPSLGITVQNISSSVAQYFNMPSGVYVYSVTQGSCSDVAGLKTGDVITSVGDYSVTSFDELKSAVKMYKAGDTVTLSVYRSGETFELSVTLDEQAASNDSNSATQTPGSQQAPNSGSDWQNAPNQDNNIPAQG